MSANVSSSSTASNQESPQEIHARLSSEWESLSPRVILQTVSNQLGQVDRDLAELGEQIGELRQKGYIFDGDWEPKVAKLTKNWPQEQRLARREIDSQSAELRQTADEIERLVTRSERDHSRLDDLERRLETFESEIRAAEEKIEQTFQRASDESGEIYAAMERVTFMLEHLHDAEFQLYPDENPVAACKAKGAGKKDEPEGVLYVTDQRLIFERVEKVATKKVLFVATEKKIVRELIWEAPVGAIEKVSAKDKGGFVGIGSKQLLTMNFDRAAKGVPDEIVMQLLAHTDNEMWQDLVEKVKSGQIAQEKYAGASQDVAAADETPAPAAPTECESCGGKLPPAFKGMQRLECEFCGSVIALD